MSYSINSDTKYATYNGHSYGPKCVITQEISTADDETRGKTISVNTFVPLEENECKEMEARRNAKPARELASLRRKRDSKLAKTDWMSNSDAPTMSTAWKNYRQALRDITKTYTSQMDAGFKWPDEPS